MISINDYVLETTGLWDMHDLSLKDILIGIVRLEKEIVIPEQIADYVSFPNLDLNAHTLNSG